MQLPRHLIALIALLSVALLGPIRLVAAAEFASAERPNILFCLADDWGWPHAGVYGDTVVKTPTFDRVAREGVLFTHAFCAIPSCTASRAAVLTGQYPRSPEGGQIPMIGGLADRYD